MSIHATAIIDPSTRLGQGVVVGPHVIIGPGVTLGDRCKIRSHAVIEHTTLGNDCDVFPFVSLGLEPQHLAYKGEPTRLEVGNRCAFRESVTVHRGTALDKSLTKIGDDGYFMALTHIAHDCVIGNHVIMANGAQLAGHVHIGDRAFISTTVGIHQHVRIGANALVSGGAMVPLDVAPFCIAQGDRAQLRGINVIGLRRAGADRTDIKLIKEVYKIVYLSNLKLDEALQQPALSVDNKWVRTFKEFLVVPKRGFLRPLRVTTSEEELVS